MLVVSTLHVACVAQPDGRTPLYVALENGKNDMFEALLKRNANPNIKRKVRLAVASLHARMVLRSLTIRLVRRQRPRTLYCMAQLRGTCLLLCSCY